MLKSDAFSLFYIRNREKEETDFLILRDKKPWLLIEAKSSDGPIAGHHGRMQEALGGFPFVQVCAQEGIKRLDGPGRYRLSASNFLQ